MKEPEVVEAPPDPSDVELPPEDEVDHKPAIYDIYKAPGMVYLITGVNAEGVSATFSTDGGQFFKIRWSECVEGAQFMPWADLPDWKFAKNAKGRWPNG